ncbi:hypothetical protein J4E91_000331 [Alternaria rosae]|nr:hypothetical protein J4E91_000331 [Alternaria rosae]
MAVEMELVVGSIILLRMILQSVYHPEYQSQRKTDNERYDPDYGHSFVLLEGKRNVQMVALMGTSMVFITADLCIEVFSRIGNLVQAACLSFGEVDIRIM